MGESIIARLERIKTGKITKSQRKLIDYFASVDHKKIIYMSITELAEATGVAEATVLRFCRSLGFNGYQEFKLRLAQDTITTFKDVPESAYVSDIIGGYQSALDYAGAALSATVLEKTTEMLTSARSVSCCGVGHSYLAARELHNRLLKMGILSYCEQDMHFQNILVSSRSAQDLLIIFSISGATKDVIEAAELARSVGMKIIVITCNAKSPLTRFADMVIASTAVESPMAPGAMASKIVQLFITDVLCYALHLRDKNRYDALVAKSNVATAGKLV